MTTAMMTAEVTGVGNDDILTMVEAAAMLKVHPETLRKRALKWGVPHKRLGTEWRFSREVLTAWMRARD